MRKAVLARALDGRGQAGVNGGRELKKLRVSLAYPTPHRGSEASGSWPEEVLSSGGALGCGGTGRQLSGAAQSGLGLGPRGSTARRARVSGGRGYTAAREHGAAGSGRESLPAGGPQGDGLELVPSDLVADSGKKALEQGRAGLLVLLLSAGLGAQASGPSLVRRSDETLVGPTSLAAGRRICYRPRSYRRGVVLLWCLVLRNQTGALANGVELEAALEGPLCCRTAALGATVPWPDTFVQAEGAKGLWTPEAGGVSAGERRGVDWNPQLP
ncbi:hypothetical protein NDU88_007565 [Pleurodeles waltl]|uniref:Uncharacterized protein n=1 Tax=Pleurodeles waltl TaxID=8319 RepID=A0AAV7NBT6_PLEWA|nr:hypothetical protein NDU88_007565 [Pleurodeles waltl]